MGPKSDSIDDIVRRGPLALAALAALSIAAGCGIVEKPVPATLAGDQLYVYTCPDDFRFTARFMGDTAVLEMPGAEYRLPNVVSASGAKYEAGDVVFWGKGLEARLELPGSERTGCMGVEASSPWEASRLLGYDFRGVGQEPGWVVQIASGRQIDLLLDYGERRLSLPAPRPVREPGGELSYQMVNNGDSVSVVVAREHCQDTMSGEEYPYSVRLGIDGREFNGCGRWLDENPLIGTTWQLIELGGEPAHIGARGSPPFIELLHGEDRMVGNTGCNGIFGGYRVSGDELEFGQLGATEMACMEPEINRQERSFSLALDKTDHYTVSSDTLTLYHGDQPLARFVPSREEKP